MMNNEKIEEKWILCLYIAGMTSAAKTALANIKQLCEEHLKGEYTVEVIDLLERPELAEGDQILAVPTLVRQLPAPLRKIIGDLSDAKKVLVGLDIKKAG
jgi:circadian clock protein KaiB